MCQLTFTHPSIELGKDSLLFHFQIPVFSLYPALVHSLSLSDARSLSPAVLSSQIGQEFFNFRARFCLSSKAGRHDGV